jgi:hypothetical protein
VPLIGFTKDEAKKSASKDRTEFCGNSFLSRQAHNLLIRREWASLDDLRLSLPLRNPTLIGLDPSLTALIGITGRRRRKIFTCTQIKKQQEQ